VTLLDGRNRIVTAVYSRGKAHLGILKAERSIQMPLNPLSRPFGEEIQLSDHQTEAALLEGVATFADEKLAPRDHLLVDDVDLDRGNDVNRHWLTNPPSATIASPVTKDASSEHSHTAASPISSGVPGRPIGVPAIA